MFLDRKLNPARHPHARTLRSKRLAESAGLAALEQFEPRLVLAINPTAEEQHMMELLNRFRTNPQGELALLTSSLSGEARSDDPDINSALDFFNVSGPVLQSQWASLTAAPALAWDEALYQMAELQSQNMILDDMQEHNLPGRPGLAARASQFGYDYTILGENIFAFAESVLHGHAGFALDWGNGPNGIQNPPGHRQSMMSSQFREVGIRIIPETAQSTQVGPLVVTQNFGTRQNFGDSWLVGVVFDDTNTNQFYTVGEGLGGVTVSAVGAAGTFITTTYDAGGYQMQLPQGTYTVTFNGGAFGPSLIVQDVVIGSTNAKLDAIAGQATPVPLIKVLGNGITIESGDSTPDPADHTAFGTIDIEAGAIVRTFTVHNEGTLALTISGLPRITLADDTGGAFTLTMDLALASIEPGEQLTFQITFDPASVGTFTTNITILSDDLETPEFRFVIEGTGVSVPTAIVLGRGTIIPDGSTQILGTNGTFYGSPNVDGEVTTRVYTLRNDGSSPLEVIGRVRILGKNKVAFRVISQPETTIAPGQSSTFTVQFDPGTKGQKNARVVIDTNDPDIGRYNFQIRGRGVVTPIIAVRGNTRPIEHGDTTPRRADNTDFGLVNVDNRRRGLQFVIRNEGRGLMRLTAPMRVNITGTHAQDFTLIIPPAEFIQSGKRSVFTVRFDPSADGVREATIVIRSNDPLTPRYVFRITGEGFSVG